MYKTIYKIEIHKKTFKAKENILVNTLFISLALRETKTNKTFIQLFFLPNNQFSTQKE